MISASASAHPNVALVKYWGKSNEKFNIPSTPSLSIALDALKTRTEVRESRSDQIEVNGRRTEDKKIKQWIAKVRHAHSIPPISIVSSSNFPSNSGLASSAAGFAALTEAVNQAFNLGWSQEQRAAWARLGSASAARSVVGAWSSLVPQNAEAASMYSSETCLIHAANYWDLRIIVVITEYSPKSISSTEGMRSSKATSPFYSSWVESTRLDFHEALTAIHKQDFTVLAKIAESSCRKMHALMLSSTPTLRYWNSATLNSIDAIEHLQNQGLPVFYSIDAGPQVKAICMPDISDEVARSLSEVVGVKQVIQSSIGGGTH